MRPRVPVAPAVALIVRERQGGRCALCTNTFGLHAHHIIPWRAGGSNDASNLVLLCPTHHAWADGSLIDPRTLRRYMHRPAQDDEIPGDPALLLSERANAVSFALRSQLDRDALMTLDELRASALRSSLPRYREVALQLTETKLHVMARFQGATVSDKDFRHAKRLGKLIEAEAHGLEAVDGDVLVAQSHMHIGLLLHKRKRYDEALERFQAASTAVRDPDASGDNPLALVGIYRTATLHLGDDSDRALCELEGILSAERQTAEAHVTGTIKRAEHHFVRNEVDEALAVLDDLEAANLGSPLALAIVHKDRAEFLDRQGETERAVAWAHSAMQIAATHGLADQVEQVANRLGRLLRRV